MKSEPLLKGQPPTSPEVFAWRTTAAGAKRHSSTAASVVIEDRSAGSAASCRILCRPSTMSCRPCNHRDNANQIAIHHGSKKRFGPLQPAADAPPQHFQDIGRACSLKHHMRRCQTLLSRRERFDEQFSYALLHKQIELLRSSDPSDPFRQGLQFAGPCFTSSASRFSLAQSSSCAAARPGSLRGSIGGNNLPLSEKIRSNLLTRCLLRMGICPEKSRSNLASFEIVRISAGSVTTTTSVMPGKIGAFHAGTTHPMRRARFRTRLPCSALVIHFVQHFRSLL